MDVSEAMKFCVVGFGCAGESAINNRPANLQRPHIALRKGATGKINGGDREPLVIKG